MACNHQTSTAMGQGLAFAGGCALVERRPASGSRQRDGGRHEERGRSHGRVEGLLRLRHQRGVPRVEGVQRKCKKDRARTSFLTKTGTIIERAEPL